MLLLRPVSPSSPSAVAFSWWRVHRPAPARMPSTKRQARLSCRSCATTCLSTSRYAQSRVGYQMAKRDRNEPGPTVFGFPFPLPSASRLADVPLSIVTPYCRSLFPSFRGGAHHRCSHAASPLPTTDILRPGKPVYRALPKAGAVWPARPPNGMSTTVRQGRDHRQAKA